jgi:hypothetical protein
MTTVNKHRFSVHEGLAPMIGTLLCALMHDSPMWPIHGEYQCRTCGRRYPVPWQNCAAARLHLVSPRATDLVQRA